MAVCPECEHEFDPGDQGIEETEAGPVIEALRQVVDDLLRCRRKMLNQNVPPISREELVTHLREYVLVLRGSGEESVHPLPLL